MFPGRQAEHRLSIVQKGGGGDVYKIDLRIGDEAFDFAHVRDAEAPDRQVGGGPVRPRHGSHLNIRDLGELLQGEPPKAATADDAQPHRCVKRGFSATPLRGFGFRHATPSPP